MEKLKSYALNDTNVNMEEQFSQLTLDVIGLALFNYNFDSLKADSPVIESVYTALKEAEARSTDILPYWKVKRRKGRKYPFSCHLFCFDIGVILDLFSCRAKHYVRSFQDK